MAKEYVIEWSVARGKQFYTFSIREECISNNP